LGKTLLMSHNHWKSKKITVTRRTSAPATGYFAHDGLFVFDQKVPHGHWLQKCTEYGVKFFSHGDNPLFQIFAIVSQSSFHALRKAGIRQNEKYGTRPATSLGVWSLPRGAWQLEAKDPSLKPLRCRAPGEGGDWHREYKFTRVRSKRRGFSPGANRVEPEFPRIASPFPPLFFY